MLFLNKKLLEAIIQFIEGIFFLKKIIFLDYNMINLEMLWEKLNFKVQDLLFQQLIKFLILNKEFLIKLMLIQELTIIDIIQYKYSNNKIVF